MLYPFCFHLGTNVDKRFAVTLQRKLALGTWESPTSNETGPRGWCCCEIADVTKTIYPLNFADTQQNLRKNLLVDSD